MKNLTTLVFSMGWYLVPGCTMLALAGCGGGGGSGDSARTQGPPPPPPDVIKTYDVTLTAADVVAGSTAAGSGQAEVRVNETQGRIEVTVTLDGLVADAVSLREGFAGTTGPEVYALAAGAAAGEWILQAQALPETHAAGLAAGGLYLLATTPAAPGGALRGQVVPAGVSVHRFALRAAEVVDDSSATGSGTAWLTLDHNVDSARLNVMTAGLDDADGGILGLAAAGRNGLTVITLDRDPVEPARWTAAEEVPASELADAAGSGILYVQLTTPDFPGGAIRGQLLPEGFELVVTDLTGQAVVMSGTAPGTAKFVRPASFELALTDLAYATSAPNAAQADVAGRVMTTLGADRFTSHVNLFIEAEMVSVELRQAPAGQNGPMVATYERDVDDAGTFSIEGLALNAVLAAGLDNQALYVNVREGDAPGGIARGQIETAASQEPADTSAFVVIGTDPENASLLDDLPDVIAADLNRTPLASSVTPAAVVFEASGGDGSFGDGNETVITPSAVTANGASVEVDLAGIVTTDDVYRLTLVGGGASGVVDSAGIGLDGDGDGDPGGRFEMAFEVQQPEVEATLTKIQAEIFTPTCATAGCHSGANPPDGMNLEAGLAYSNIVNVQSVQMPGLERIEPGNPDDSYLVRKIQGTGIVASRMPLGGPALSQEAIDLVRQWVLEGALDN